MRNINQKDLREKTLIKVFGGKDFDKRIGGERV